MIAKTHIAVCSMRVCVAMTKLIDRLRRRASTQEERSLKALESKELAENLIDIWKAETTSSTCSFYMHICVHHLPDMIARLPIDIILASGDSFEAKNQQLKRILRRLSRARFILDVFLTWRQANKQAALDTLSRWRQG